jgi:hypothetical protein
MYHSCDDNVDTLMQKVGYDLARAKLLCCLSSIIRQTGKALRPLTTLYGVLRVYIGKAGRLKPIM